MEQSVGFTARADVHSHIDMMMDRLKGLGKRIEKDAEEDKRKRALEKDTGEGFTDQVTRGRDAMKACVTAVRDAFALADSETTIKSSTMRKMGYPLQSLLLAGMGSCPEAVQKMTARDLAAGERKPDGSTVINLGDWVDHHFKTSTTITFSISEYTMTYVEKYLRYRR